MTFEVRNLGSFQEAEGENCGNSFFGTKGFYVVNQRLLHLQRRHDGPARSDPRQRPRARCGRQVGLFLPGRAFAQARGHVRDDAGCVPLLRSLPSCQHGFPTWTVTELRSSRRSDSKTSKRISTCRASIGPDLKCRSWHRRNEISRAGAMPTARRGHALAKAWPLRAVAMAPALHFRQLISNSPGA